MRLRPRDLPKIRIQTLRHLTTLDSDIRANLGPDDGAGLDALASHLKAAELYWVTSQMAALAVSAGSKLDAVRWANSDRPSGCGLIMFDGGVGSVPTPRSDIEIPVEAIAWGPARDGCMISLLLSRHRLVQLTAAGPHELATERIPPLIPLVGFTLPVTITALPFADIPQITVPDISSISSPDGSDIAPPLPVLQALAASWSLMEQPSLADRAIERPDKSVRRAHAREKLPDPEVTIVDLRRLYSPQVPPEYPDDKRSRDYRYRWVVSGHWRDQPHGPDRALRRRQWIPAYVKGPDGAPLLLTEKVNVWRR